MAKAFKILTSPLSLIDDKLGSAVSSIAIAAISIANPIAGLVIAGLKVGTELLAGKGPPAPSSQTQRLAVSINPREPFKRVFGKTAMATDIRYEEWFGTDQERCRWIVAVASHKIKSVLEIWIEQELAWSAASGYASKYAGYFFVRHIVLEGGASNGVTFGSGQWDDTRRLTGCAFVDLEFKVTGNSKKAESPFSSGLPSRCNTLKMILGTRILAIA